MKHDELVHLLETKYGLKTQLLTFSEGQKWIDVLTENELRRMVAKTIHSVKMVENENELKKIESDFG